MIIFSQYKLEIGKIYGDNTIANSKLHIKGKIIHKSRFMVMKEATKEDYLEYYKEKYSKYPNNEPWYNNFYQISVD